jgi:3-hydroxyisobutyrate dehydrogenase-like beta-hydroxyacid dehydrogenase
MTVIAVLGLGEAGSLIAADLAAAGATVQAFDPGLPAPPGDHTPAPGASAPPAVRVPGAGVSAPPGVHIAGSDAEACAGASLVLSVNSAADATDALRESLPALETGTIWADLNTATPGLKERLAALGGQRVRVVDVALMSPVPGRGLRTPMTASGPAAGELAAVLGGFGATVEVLDGPVGTAATRKLLRSVFYKGMAAAVVEALDAAKAAGLEEWLRGNIRDELIRSNAATLDRLVDGSVKHAVRRRDEMAAATELLEELGLSPRIAPAARDVLEALIPPE